MDYRMLGDILPAVEIRLQAERLCIRSPEGIAWMSDGSHWTQCKRRAYEGLGRMFSANPCLWLPIRRPGRTVPLRLHPLCREDIGHRYGKDQPDLPEGAFLCAQTTVEINTVLTTAKVYGRIFGGEGFILQQIQEAAWPFWRWMMEMWWRGFWPPEK